MSSRHMKKVFGSEQDELIERVSDDDGPGPATFRKNKSFSQNPYEVLNEGSDSDAKEDESQEAEKASDSDEETVQKKKKKKRKNKKKVLAESENATPGTSTSSSAHVYHPDPEAKKAAKAKPTFEIVDEASNEVQLNNRRLLSLFSLDTKFLNHDFELKRIFGSKVIKQELAKSGGRRSYRGPGKLVAAREKWPNVTGSGTGLSMELVRSDSNGRDYFKFQHDSYYQEIQRSFMHAVDSFDPNNIVAIVRSHPYHIDSQIQLSDLSGEDKQVAAEIIELAIHTMESAAHPKFCMYSPTSCLEYKYQENRPFHILLFKHLTFVGLRSTYRCALELCKRLLSLDPENDPLCVTLLLDFYAIKAGECQWFCDLYSFWETKKNLSQLPNWAYSVALSQFLLSIGGDVNLGMTSSTKSKKTDVQKKLSEKEREELGKKSDELLEYSILMFPSILLPLLQKCGIQCDSRVRNHSYFNSVAQNSSTEALKLLSDLYVWRSHHLWKDPSVLKWLEKNANAALDKVDAKDPKISEYEAKRRRRYQGTPRNVIRHILITDEKELTVHLPKDLSKEIILNYDPLPPLDTVNIYNYGDHLASRPQATTGDGVQRGILSSLFRSFLMDLNAGRQQADQQPQRVGGAGMRNPGPAQGDANMDNAAGAARDQMIIDAGGAAIGLQQSVNVLLDAMRNLLAVTNPPEVLEESGDDTTDDEINPPA